MHPPRITLSPASRSQRWRLGLAQAVTGAIALVAVAAVTAAAPHAAHAQVFGTGVNGVAPANQSGALTTTAANVTVFAYGTYSGGVFTKDPAATIGAGLEAANPGVYSFTSPGFSTGGAYNGVEGTSYASIVQPVNSYPSPNYYDDPVNAFGVQSNWVSAYADTDTTPQNGDPVFDDNHSAQAGVTNSYTNESGRVGTLMPNVFAYTTYFTVDPSQLTFDLNGLALSDDDILAAVVDYDVNASGGFIDTLTLGSASKVLTVTPGGSSQAYQGPPYSFSGTGIANTPGQVHSLTFLVSNQNNDRTALSFVAVSAIPEPGAVAAGVTMASSLFGMMGTARLRRRRREGRAA